jgi:ABC-type phosphate transport system auxiliary subunit
MSDPLRELPKFPGEQADARPEPPDAPADRLRHAVPALVLVAGAAVGLVVVIGLAVLVLTRGVGANWLTPVLMLAVFLALPVVAISAALYQRAKMRREREGG